MQIRAQDLAQLASPADLIFDSLREAITEGSLLEGAVLRQDTIAKMFNVSRIPVREALTRLEEQGLVSTQRYRGAVVASLSLDEIAEIFEFRSLVEPEVVRYSVGNASQESLDLARDFVDFLGIEIPDDDDEDGLVGDLDLFADQGLSEMTLEAICADWDADSDTLALHVADQIHFGPQARKVAEQFT